jgi:hypothetical protein
MVTNEVRNFLNSLEITDPTTPEAIEKIRSNRSAFRAELLPRLRATLNNLQRTHGGKSLTRQEISDRYARVLETVAEQTRIPYILDVMDLPGADGFRLADVNDPSGMRIGNRLSDASYRVLGLQHQTEIHAKQAQEKREKDDALKSYAGIVTRQPKLWEMQEADRQQWRQDVQSLISHPGTTWEQKAYLQKMAEDRSGQRALHPPVDNPETLKQFYLRSVGVGGDLTVPWVIQHQYEFSSDNFERHLNYAASKETHNEQQKKQEDKENRHWQRFYSHNRLRELEQEYNPKHPATNQYLDPEGGDKLAKAQRLMESKYIAWTLANPGKDYIPIEEVNRIWNEVLTAYPDSAGAQTRAEQQKIRDAELKKKLEAEAVQSKKEEQRKKELQQLEDNPSLGMAQGG